MATGAIFFTIMNVITSMLAGLGQRAVTGIMSEQERIRTELRQRERDKGTITSLITLAENMVNSGLRDEAGMILSQITQYAHVMTEAQAQKVASLTRRAVMEPISEELTTREMAIFSLLRGYDVGSVEELGLKLAEEVGEPELPQNCEEIWENWWSEVGGAFTRDFIAYAERAATLRAFGMREEWTKHLSLLDRGDCL